MFNILIFISFTMRQIKTVFFLSALLMCANIMGQTLTISATGDTGTSGTNWGTSGSNPVTISVTGTADINVSVIQGYLNSGTDVELSSTIDINWDSPLNATDVDGDLILTGPSTGNNIYANINANLNIAGNLSFSDSRFYVIVSPGIQLNISGNLSVYNTGGLKLDSNSTMFSTLMLEGNLEGDKFFDYLRWSNPTPGNDLLTSPVGGVALGMLVELNGIKLLRGSINNVLHYLVTTYDESINNYGTLFNWQTPGGFNALPTGIGYRIGRLDTEITDNQKIQFTQRISNYNNIHKNSVSVALTHGGEGWNLIGNPYPTYLSLSTVLNNNNANMYGGAYNAIYSYNGDAVNPWSVYNNLSNAKIAPGQAFFVRSAESGSNFSFTPAMQSGTGGDDFIQGRNTTDSQVYNAGIILSSSLGTYSSDLYFHDLGSNGLDVGYDAATWQGDIESYSIYSHLVSENQGLSMAIQTLNNDALSEEVTTIIPLGLEVQDSQQLSISLSDSSVLPESGNLYLEDRDLGVFTNLREQSYSINSGSGLSGVGRFYLHAGSNATLSNGLETYDSIGVYAPTGRDVIVVTGVTEPNMNLSIYDITGRKLLDHELSATGMQELAVSQLSSSAVVVHLEGKQGSRSIKLIINP